MRVNNEIMDAKAGVFTAPIKWAKTWEELGEIKGVFVNYDSIIIDLEFITCATGSENMNTFATKEQAARYGIIAAQLSQLVANLNGEPDWKPKMGEKYYYIVQGNWNGLSWNYLYKTEFSMIHFPLKTQEAAEFTIKHHANLWRKFYGI